MSRSAQTDEQLHANGADLTVQINELRAKVEEMVNHLATLGKAGAGSVADSVIAETKHLRRSVARESADLQEQAGDLVDDVARYLKHRPVATLGIAAGLGFVIGLVTARR